uniref:Hikeshi-like domain-containing protein n=1 Tax=Ditylenchus dipsaci TaxID=166011 RepID=A0A915DQD0_9BILA
MATSNVFGIIVAGRLLQTNFVQAGETEFVAEVSNSDSINHIVVFLTGVSPFPDLLGGSVYIRWQNVGSTAGDWNYLGHISNSKASAIFRISQLNKGASGQNGSSSSMFASSGSFSNINALVASAQIGIMVEPLTTIESRVPAQGSQASQQSAVAEFTEKMLRNFLNAMQSFAIAMPSQSTFSSMGNGSARQEVVPLSKVQEWFSTFQRRLQINPNFWKNMSD